MIEEIRILTGVARPVDPPGAVRGRAGAAPTSCGRRSRPPSASGCSPPTSPARVARAQGPARRPHRRRRVRDAARRPRGRRHRPRPPARGPRRGPRHDVQGRKDARAKQAGVRFARRFVLIVPLGMALAGHVASATAGPRTATPFGQVLVVVGIAMVVGVLGVGRPAHARCPTSSGCSTNEPQAAALVGARPCGSGTTLLLGELRWFRRRPLVDRLRALRARRRATAGAAAPCCRSSRSARSSGRWPGRSASGWPALFGVNEDAGRPARADPLAARRHRLPRPPARLVARRARRRRRAGASAPACRRRWRCCSCSAAPLLAFLVVEQQLAGASARWQRRLFLELPVVAEQLGMLLSARATRSAPR